MICVLLVLLPPSCSSCRVWLGFAKIKLERFASKLAELGYTDVEAICDRDILSVNHTSFAQSEHWGKGQSNA
jgi:hypothetical protein